MTIIALILLIIMFSIILYSIFFISRELSDQEELDEYLNGENTHQNH